MERAFFLDCEALTPADSLPLDSFIDELAFNEQGLIPVITQDIDTGSVLMLAWMNKTSLYQTLQTRRMTYWSRSRNALWEKGATSGHYQHVKSLQFDCDGDAILCKVEQIGAACHTGRKDCFYFQADDDGKTISITSAKPESR